MKLRDILGLTGYYWYGFGGHSRSATLPLTVSGTELVNAAGQEVCTIRACVPYKLTRAFVDNWIVTRSTVPPVVLSTEPTEQNFYYDSFFRLQKANGIKTIWSATGCFDWYNLGTNPSTGKPYSQRKSACYDPTKSPLDPAAWADLAELCRQIALYYKGTGLLDYIQILNEYDFRWNVPHVLTNEEYAVCFNTCYDAIRSVNTEIGIITGGTINPTLEVFDDFWFHSDDKRAKQNKKPIRDAIYDLHWYFRDKSNNQGSGTTGISPEDAKIYAFGKAMDERCRQRMGIKWMCTETGYATDNSKQHVPDLEGISRLEGQGPMIFRTALIWAACEFCEGITFWHCRDLYDSEPYAYAGINNKDWSAKPANVYLSQQLQTYGDWDVVKYSFIEQPNAFAVSITKDGVTKQLVWSNTTNNNTLNLTPVPKEGTLSNTNPDPNPIKMKLVYYTNDARLNPTDLTEGATLPTGNIYIEAKDAVSPVTFTLIKDGTVVVPQRDERTAPFDLMGEVNAKPKPYVATVGAYSLIYKDKNMTTSGVINFQCGTVPPPVAPDILSIEVTTSSGTVPAVHNGNYESVKQIAFKVNGNSDTKSYLVSSGNVGVVREGATINEIVTPTSNLTSSLTFVPCSEVGGQGVKGTPFTVFFNITIPQLNTVISQGPSTVVVNGTVFGTYPEFLVAFQHAKSLIETNPNDKVVLIPGTVDFKIQ